jgi:hypothetical protein
LLNGDIAFLALKAINDYFDVVVCARRGADRSS